MLSLNKVYIDSICVCFSTIVLIPVITNTDLAGKDEGELSFLINQIIAEARLTNKKFLRMLKEGGHFKIVDHTNKINQESSESKLNFKRINPFAKERFIDELLEDDDIDILHTANVYCRPIVMWVWSRTQRAFGKLLRMIKCGNFQKLLVVLFTMLLDKNKDVAVAIKLNAKEFQCAKGCISRKSGMAVKILSKLQQLLAQT